MNGQRQQWSLAVVAAVERASPKQDDKNDENTQADASVYQHVRRLHFAFLVFAFLLLPAFVLTAAHGEQGA